jgi:hypothetical protein
MLGQANESLPRKRSIHPALYKRPLASQKKPVNCATGFWFQNPFKVF